MILWLMKVGGVGGGVRLGGDCDDDGDGGSVFASKGTTDGMMDLGHYWGDRRFL
jgi:hypothetical protein